MMHYGLEKAAIRSSDCEVATIFIEIQVCCHNYGLRCFNRVIAMSNLQFRYYK